MDYDLEIEFEKAEQSIEYDRGLAAHYKASAFHQQRLLDLARQEHDRADQLQKLLEVSQTQNIQLQLENQRLQARVAELEARPNIVTDTYFENFNAEKVINFRQQPIGKRKKAKYIEDTNQLFLELWKEKATVI